METKPDNYNVSLLRALRQHRRKFTVDAITQPQKGSHQNHPPEYELRNHREFFETGFLRILSRNDLGDVDIDLLPPLTAQKFLPKLRDLLVVLNENSNHSFEAATHTSSPSQSLFQPNGSYPQLELRLSSVEQSDGTFSLANGTNLSLFKFDTLSSAVGTTSLVREINHILDGVQFTLPVQPPAVVEKRLTSYVEIDNWIRSFDSKYRILVGRILDAILEAFARCESPDCNTPHQIMIRLLDVPVSDLTDSETDLDIFICCPRSNKWQSTRCKLNRYGFS
jgi:hypothetical protein